MQSAINMHLSQISHGKLGVYDSAKEGLEAMFLPDDENEVVVGYAPSMIHLLVMDSSGELLFTGCWYDWRAGYIWTGGALGPVESFLTTNERGFVIDGEEVVSLNSDAALIIWETYGCQNKTDYQSPMNPDPVAADGAMDPIPGWEPVTDHSHDAEEESS